MSNLSSIPDGDGSSSNVLSEPTSDKVIPADSVCPTKMSPKTTLESTSASSIPDGNESSSVLSEPTLGKVIPADSVSLAKASLKFMLESTSAPMSRAELLKFVESEKFEIRSQEIARKRSMQYKCKYCGAAFSTSEKELHDHSQEIARKRSMQYKCKYCGPAFSTSEKELHDHVFYCSIGVPWSEY